MACFVTPVVEAIITTTIEKKLEKKQKKNINNGEVINISPFHKKLKLLNFMLWSASILLILEHIYTGEVTFIFPFFTAIANGNTLTMLKEIAINGTLISCSITLIWCAVLLLSHIFKRKTIIKDNKWL